ncbi:MAG: hypothetical protein ACD_3C00040G0001 [uncultured bacterium (gcode 4)]|uniref:Prolipoprotein diacylglyceryl transferase n=1 Tax=uncultured bacterium (gcode 4) TaxID=1234023 RepID=K2GYU4_9BACT|nr:MAG: hypothetical protein ACD_3C00040G0001 [uncultured bacterium (gcode 4)]
MKIFDITIFWVHISPSYYWLMYALWFIFSYLILRKRKCFSEKELDSLMLYVFIWVILWGRLWYVLFYDFSYYLKNPLDIIATWKWWMSFHGWVLWVIIAMILFTIKNYRVSLKKASIKDFKKQFLKVADNVVSVLPIWLGLWRIGNYLNKELLWREYAWFLAVEKNGKYYFPIPLLEALFEWLILYIIVTIILKKSKNPWQTGWAFLFFYGIFRFTIEFLRVPDAQLWYIYWLLTMGQILSIPMIILWAYFLLKKNAN